MNLDYFQVSILAIIQGLTEFLPISSSAHLIFPSALWGWPDQGLSFDIAVHVGTFFAVLFFYRETVHSLAIAWLAHVVKGNRSAEANLAWLIVLATIPAVLAGAFLQSAVEQYARAIPVIAISSVVFAFLLFISEKKNRSSLDLRNLSWQQALFIGVAQALALIPGSSRSGATITAALFCNLDKHDAAKFSFLLSMPIIFASGLLKGGQLLQAEQLSIDWLQLAYGVVLSGLVALGCIHWFLKLIERIGFLPFVIYRIVLGAVLGIVYLT
jgi:undecaprenyl-diphosphatase